MRPKYKIILCDPPWSYHNYNYAHTLTGQKAKRGVVKEYPTMSVDEIASLPIESVASDDSVLLLWSTPPLLPEALCVISSWGFKYLTKAFCWVKSYEKSGKLFWGMGNWTRSNTEDCLLAVRGKPRRVSASVHQIVQYPVGSHSTKPPIVRDLIVRLMGDVPRIELFSRDRVEGWDCVGNAINGEDIRLSLARIIAEQETE